MSMCGQIRGFGTSREDATRNVLAWVLTKSRRSITLSGSKQSLRMLVSRREPGKSTTTILTSQKIPGLPIPSLTFPMLKFLLFVVIPTISSSSPMMHTQFFLPSPSWPLSRPSTTSTQATPPISLKQRRASRSQLLVFLPATESPSYPSNHQLTPVSSMRRSRKTMSTCGWWTLDGLEEDTEWER